MKSVLNAFFSLMCAVACSGLNSCSENDTAATSTVVPENVGEPYAEVLSEANAKMLTPLLLRGDKSAKGYVYLQLKQATEGKLSVTFKVDEAALKAYNKTNGTSYAMYPADKISLENDGASEIVAGKKRSETVAVTVSPGGVKGRTYAIPLSATVSDGEKDITNNKIYMYLVTPQAEAPQINAGRTVKNLCYIEVNRESMLNAGEYVMKDSGEPFFDIASVFAANIRLNSDGEPYLSCNEQTTFVLDHIGDLVRPLQAKGIKVHLSVLGDHTAAGMRSLTDDAADAFARQLKYYVDIYGFDGVDFDDEYSTYSTDQATEPYIPSAAVMPDIESCTPERYAHFVYACRQAMPDVNFGIYWYKGNDYPSGTVNGKAVNDLVDYAVYGLYGAWRAIDAETIAIEKQCPYAVSLTIGNENLHIDEPSLSRIKNEGWGYFAIYDLLGSRGFEEEFSRISRILYGQDVTWSGKLYDRTNFTPKTMR